MSGKIICIEGNIGAGKSSLLRELEEKGYQVFTEDLDKWGFFLTNFYDNPSRWSFTLQVAILNSCAQNYAQMRQMCKTHQFIFVERSMESSLVFAQNAFKRGYLTLQELNVIEELYERLKWTPDYRFYLDTPVDVCFQRIHKRGRPCEKNITKEYLQEIAKGHVNIHFDGRIGVVKTQKELADEVISSCTRNISEDDVYEDISR